MSRFARPTIGVSACLEFKAVRYNGVNIPDEFVRKLDAHVKFVKVCPEVGIGLGVPRNPIRIILSGQQRRIVQPATGKDVTEKLRGFADKFLDKIEEIDGFILKSRSPSCGIKDVKLHSEKDGKTVVGKAEGIFGGAVLEKFPGKAIEDEGRLTNFTIRENFLTKVFTLADFRVLKKSPSMKKLVDFHAKNKFLFMAYNQKEMREMGRVAANHDKFPVAQVCRDYDKHLHDALARIPRFTSNINVLMHALGYFSKFLTAKEKAYFLDTLEKYRNEKLPLSAVNGIIKAWVIKYEVDYLERQTFFEPYPAELVSITDSGKGR